MSARKFYLRDGEVGAFSCQKDSIKVSSLTNGEPLNLPMLIVEGKQDGPTMGLIAAIHGAEQVGTDVIRRVLTSVNPTQLKGRIVAVPIANPLAFEAKTRETPNDMTNLNRVFPGKVGASFTERLAYEIVEQFVKKCDFLIDYHSGAMFGTANYVLVNSDREIGLKFGCDNVFVGPSAGGGIRNSAESLGCPCITTELGGIDCGGREDKWVKRTVVGTYNLMKLWGLLDGQYDLPPKQVLFTEKMILRPRFGGMYYTTPEARVNNVVPRGTTLAYMVNPTTFEIIEELKAPYDRNLILLLTDVNCGCMSGDHCYFIANYDTCEIIEN